MDLSKQQALSADQKEIQRFKVTGNLDQARNTKMSFIIDKSERKGS